MISCNRLSNILARLAVAWLLLLVVQAAGPVAAVRADEENTAAKKEQKEDSPATAEEKLVVTRHSATIAGQEIQYTATAGTLPIRNEQGEIKGSMFFVAYTREDVQEPAKRPLTFCFNGGPGSSSVWLHLGMLGPRRVRLPENATPLQPPYSLHANPYSLLDITDLVFIDPISTGYSRPATEKDKGEFHGYDEDIRSVARFIHDYVTRFERWQSPKFLIGESYGGVRAAGLAAHLQQRYKLELNGILIISGVVNFQTLRFGPGNDLPYVLFLPSYAATAWYHGVLPGDLQNQPLRDVVKQAEAFATGDYLRALFLGSDLPAAQRRAVAEQLSRFTGLSKAYVEGADLRISMGRFGKELLRRQQRTVGRFDSRYKGVDRDNVGESYEYDASGAAIFGPFTAMLNDYMRRELEYEGPGVYEILTGKVQPWSYSRFENRYVDATDSLRRAMAANPYLKVFIACGYYDLATPHYAMDYTVRHLGLADELRENITVRYYEGGHMMYIYEPAMKRLRKHLVDFYQDAT